MSGDKEQKSTAGHRSRCKQRLLSEGSGVMTDTEILEMLLFYAVPRADTRHTAETLIAKFGSLDGVIHADDEEITKISGLKDNAKVLFALLREISSRAAVISCETDLPDGGLSEYLLKLFRNKDMEVLYALYFAADGSFVGSQRIFCGNISSVKFSLRTITEGAIRVGSTGVVLAHNHPSGSPVPSYDDILSTKRIAVHLAANEITLINHYIVGKDEVVGILDQNNTL